MLQALLHPRAVFAQMRRTLTMMMGRGKPNDLFLMNSDGLWQALWVNWICAALIGMAPGALLDLPGYILFILTSVVASLLYALLVFRILERIEKPDVFLPFMVPYLWLNIMQVALFGLVLIITQATGLMTLQYLYLPLAIWMLYWLIKVARDQTGLGLLFAVGFLAGRVLVDIVLGWAASSNLIS